MGYDGLSLMSALMIQGNETEVGTYSNKEKTGYGFIVYMLRNGDIHTEIVSTLPHYPYESSQKAKEEGESLVSRVREMDLTLKKKNIEGILGCETSKEVSEIVDKANNVKL